MTNYVGAVAPDQQECRLARLHLLQLARDLADVADLLPVDLEDHVAGDDAAIRRRAVAIDVGDDRAAAVRRQVEPARHFRRDRIEVMPKSVVVGCRSSPPPPPLRRAVRFCSASRSSSSIVTVSGLRWLLRNTTIGTLVPGLVLTTIATSESLSLTGLPLNSTTTSPGSMPALSAGPLGLTVADQRAVGVRQAERLGRLGA